MSTTLYPTLSPTPSTTSSTALCEPRPPAFERAVDLGAEPTTGLGGTHRDVP